MPPEKTAFRRFNLSVFLHFIGRGMYAIFVPILLLKNNYSLNTVLIFLLCSSLTTIITSYLAQKIFRHQRAIFFNFLAVIAEIFLILLLSYNTESPLILIGITLGEGIYYGFYYISYHSIINHYTSQKKIGRNLGNLKIALTVAGIFAPIVGAWLLDINGIYLILSTIIFLFLSLIPLLDLTAEDINGYKLIELSAKKIKKELIQYAILSAIEIIIFTLWAIYTFLGHFSLMIIGTIAVASSLANIFITQEIKVKLNVHKIRRMIKITTMVIIIFASIYRYIAPEQILLTNLIFGTAFLLAQLSVEVDLFQKLKGYQTYHSSALLSITAFLSRTFVIILTLIIGLKYAMLLPIIFSIGFIWLIIKKNEKTILI